MSIFTDIRNGWLPPSEWLPFLAHLFCSVICRKNKPARTGETVNAGETKNANKLYQRFLITAWWLGAVLIVTSLLALLLGVFDSSAAAPSITAISTPCHVHALKAPGMPGAVWMRSQPYPGSPAIRTLDHGALLVPEYPPYPTYHYVRVFSLAHMDTGFVFDANIKCGGDK